MKPKIIIMGASGYVGNHIYNYLSSRGYEVLGTGSSNTKDGMVQFNLLTDNFHESPLYNFAKDKKTILIHCAGLTLIDKCKEDPEKAEKINVTNTIKLLNDALSNRIKPIFISTSNVFNGEKGYYKEDDERSPINIYGHHKMLVEKVIENNPGVLIYRLETQVGGLFFSKNFLLKSWKQADEEENVKCIKDNILSPTFVFDIGRAVELGIKNDLCGVYHVANKEIFSREELTRQFFEYMNKKVKIKSLTAEEIGLTDKRVLKPYLDSTKFVKATKMHFTSMKDAFKDFKERLESANLK